MLYAIYDVLDSTTPIRIWDDTNSKYITAIYDTEAEAITKSKELNQNIIEDAYFVKPYTVQIDVTLAREEVETLISLCTIAMEQLHKNQKIERMQFLQNISEKLKAAK